MRVLPLLLLLACARPSNRLALESSPYLRQHAHNPVDWYPWGREALDRAQSLDRPVLLSIGYSTCHWCHVMERESFENREIARLLNENFVSIKVDREERPDIDSIYMEACFQITGSGGWPLTILMGSDGKPFFAGTYFPPDEFKEVLTKVLDLWKRDRASLTSYSSALATQLSKRSNAAGEVGSKNLESVTNAILASFDPAYGGFDERPPKFPIPHRLSFLLSQHKRNPKILPQVRFTLDKMAQGGIFDQLGGGFHRYSTDRIWLVSHFEKMLYDQALLTRAYVEAFQVTGDEYYASIARRTIDYVLRDLRRGAFLSAEDADSEGVEGKFYEWTPEEIREVLGDEAAGFLAYYAIEQKILHQPKFDRAQEKKWEGARAKLLAAREKRVRPHRDDKILTDWNGLMIGALAMAGGALREPAYLRAAVEAVEYVLANRRRPDGRLMHTASIPGFVDDYAFFVWGLLDLYEATLQPRWLKEAAALSQGMIELFGDEKEGGLFFTAKDAEALIARTKESYDGAIPAGNSAAARNLLRLGHMLQKPEWTKRGEAILKAFGGYIERRGPNATQMLLALEFSVGPSSEVILVGDAAPMHEALLARYMPNRVIVHRSEELFDLIPALKGYTAIDGKPTAYVCRNFTCQAPTTDPARMLENLRQVE
jgi:hypothetical protein